MIRQIRVWWDKNEQYAEAYAQWAHPGRAARGVGADDIAAREDSEEK
jgi:hypothetical protein